MSPLSMVDPVFKVATDARPSNYEVTHISWERPDSNLNWFRYVVVRSPNGYPTTPNDGQVIFPNYSSTWDTDPSITPLPSIGFTDDVIIRIDSVSTGGVVTGATIKERGASSGIAMTSVSPTSTGNLKGKSLVVNISTGGSITVVSGGGDYVVGDILRIPGNSLLNPTSASTLKLSGITSSTQLGVTNTFHVYDNGPTYATTANPGVTSGTNPYTKKYNKYYYSLFAYVAPSTDTADILPSIADIIPLVKVGNNSAYTNFTWLKLGEASSVVVHQNATRNTKDVLLDHLPAFYSGKNNFNQNKDLSDFLSLFAFHLDVYLAETKSVFNMADAETNDEALLTQLLKQFGSELTQISDLAQARKVLANIVRNYSLGGSTLGLKNLVESYTGNAVSQIQGLNILPDYNTSSFVENIGNWYPLLTVSNSFDNNYPYDYTLEPIEAATHKLVPTDSMVAQLFDASLVGTTNVNISPHASFLGKVAYLTTTSGTYIDNNYDVKVTASAITSTSSTTVKVNDTSKLKLGAIPVVIGSGGVFSPQTVITFIDKDGVTFKINIPPSTQIDVGNTIAISNTITSNSLSIHPANLGATPTATGTVTFYSGSRMGALSTTATVSTTDTQYLPAVGPNIVKVGDYVSGHQSIPTNTKVLSIEASATNTFVLSNKLTGSIPTAHTLFFSSNPNRGLSAAVDMIPVSPSMPYSFGAHFNANNATTRSTVVSLEWYDNNGSVISTNTVTAVAPTNSSPFSNGNYKKTWYPTIVTATSPTNAAYVTPSFSIVSAYNDNRYCVDSMILARPINVIKKSRTSNVATLTTDVPHNFFYRGGYGANNVAVVIPDDSTFGTSSAALTKVVQDEYGKYTFSYANSGADVAETTTTGYASSIPMVVETVNGGTIPLTAFQDARETILEVVANRVNLVRNPSFDYDTVGSSSTAYDWSTYASCTIDVIADNNAYTGSACVKVKKASTGFSLPVGIIQTNYMKVTAGKAYSASCRISEASWTIQLGIHWYNSLGVELSVDYGDAVADTTIKKWVQLESKNKVAPANAVYAKLSIDSYATATGARTFKVDGVMFEQSETVNDYFNGDFDGYNYLSTRNSMWEGVPGQSKSHLYNNRTSNLDNIDTLTVRGINYA